MNNIPTNERTVHTWNAQRAKAKELFTQKEVNALDASGYITEWLKG